MPFDMISLMFVVLIADRQNFLSLASLSLLFWGAVGLLRSDMRLIFSMVWT